MKQVLLFVLLGITGQASATPAIEFLWEPADPDGDVRSQAMVIVTGETDDARMCWKSMNLEPGAYEAEWRIRDAADQVVATVTHRVEDDTRPVVSCHRVPEPPQDAVFGEWQFRVAVDGLGQSERSVEVVQSFEGWSQYELGYMPYVRGRTNYRSEYREHYAGSFLIELTVGADGSVTDVTLIESEGATEFAQDIVLESGRRFRFLPDPARTEDPLRIRQRVNLHPGD